ncbi:hypothetical protein [Flavobacterium sp.]|jgi:hypothetical protein|uniref:hypothetical protein n=1 Tax=Flavobacterium sp. TaxID=239 RepID=UPI003D2C9B6C
MKQIIIIGVLLFLVGCAKKPLLESVSANSINNNTRTDKYEIIISKVISDSRCPVDVNCVWAGEVELMLSIYKENVFYTEELITVSYKNTLENKSILEKYTSNKKIKSIEVLPEKKQGVEIKLQDYSLKIDYIE